MGEESADSVVDAYGNLANFRQGGKWDLQRTGGEFDKRFIDSPTIVIGIYAAAAQIEFADLMGMQNYIRKRLVQVPSGYGYG
jgi:hypothetical protein